jgi:phosphoadenosine phosphosulfate reductase
VLWVDHGYNRPATYRHAEDLRRRLGLNLKPYLPRMTAAHRDAIQGPSRSFRRSTVSSSSVRS